jgi:hypothetical protein
VIQAARRHGLGAEAGAKRRVEDARSQHLERHLAAEVELLGEIHSTHAARAEEAHHAETRVDDAAVEGVGEFRHGAGAS